MRPEHPLRRRYAAELALGVGFLVLASLALLLGRGSRAGRAESALTARSQLASERSADRLAQATPAVVARAESQREAVGGLPREPRLDPVALAAVDAPPEFGSLVVRVLGYSGERVRDALTVELYGWPADSAAVDDAQINSAKPVDGAATFSLVELGLALRIEVRLKSEATVPGRLELAGPRVAGECVEATVRLGRDLPALRMHLVDEGGAPLARARIRGSISWGESTLPQVLERETDDEGGLTLLLLPTIAGGTPRSLTLASTQGPRKSATLDMPRLDPNGVHQLGRIVLAGTR